MIGEMDFDIPDVAEAIVAFKCWEVAKDDEGFLLRAMNGGEGTRPGEPQPAMCQMQEEYGDAEDAHFSPMVKCSCGYYTFKNPVDMVRQYKIAKVYGEAWVWGQVIPHEKGYRSEFCEPKNLFLMENGTEEEDLEFSECGCDCGTLRHQVIGNWNKNLGPVLVKKIADRYGVGVKPMPDIPPPPPPKVISSRKIRGLPPTPYQQAGINQAALQRLGLTHPDDYKIEELWTPPKTIFFNGYGFRGTGE